MTIVMACMVCALFAQEGYQYDPHQHKVIPDKVFEIGLPILFLFLSLNAILAFLKTLADNRVKQRMIEKGISEESLIRIFREGQKLNRLQPLKWFMFTFATGFALLAIYYIRDSTGILAMAILILFNSLAALGYYVVLSRHSKGLDNKM